MGPCVTVLFARHRTPRLQEYRFQEMRGIRRSFLAGLTTVCCTVSVSIYRLISMYNGSDSTVSKCSEDPKPRPIRHSQAHQGLQGCTSRLFRSRLPSLGSFVLPCYRGMLVSPAVVVGLALYLTVFWSRFLAGGTDFFPCSTASTVPHCNPLHATGLTFSSHQRSS